MRIYELIILLFAAIAIKDIRGQDYTSPARNLHSPFFVRSINFPSALHEPTSYWPSNFHAKNNGYAPPRFRDTELDSSSAEERSAEGENEEIDEAGRNPFVDDVSSNDGQGIENTNPGFQFQNSFPFFDAGRPFLNFGGFGFGKPTQPWWRGSHVCTEREEDIEDDNTEKKNQSREDAFAAGSSDVEIVSRPSQAAQLFFGGIQFSLNSCVEKTNKHICKQVVSQNGMKKTLTVSHQCCHGYGRPRNADLSTPCEKLELKSLIETAEELGGKEFIQTAKNNGLEEKLSSNLTIFIPTNNAFTKFSEQMLENNLVVLPLSKSKRSRRAASDPTGITTKELALNHIVKDWIDIEDVKNEDLLMTMYGNATIRMNLFPKLPNHPRGEYPFLYTANCAPLIKLNKLTTNGIIHVVDKVLTPVTMSVMDIIRGRDDMAVFRTILEKTKISELLESNKAFTVLAPTDNAFEKLDIHLRRILKEGKGCAANILRNHILDLTFCSAAVASQYRTSAFNLMGQQMNFERVTPDETDEKTRGSKIVELTDAQNIVINGQAKILENDIMGTNGVVHVVDSIMPTETALPITTLLETKNLTDFKRLIEAANLENDFDDLINVTFFAPTDKALEGSYWKQKLNEDPASLKNNAELKEFLNYHIIPTITKTTDLTERKFETMAKGQDLRVNLYSTNALFSNIMNRATVNCARLIHFDDQSCGSILHQVDKVLKPPTMNLLQTLEANKDYSMFLQLIKDANLTHLLENSSDSYTLLVPKNDVFREVEDWYVRMSKNASELEHLIKSHIVNDVICCSGIIPTNWPFVRTIETINAGQLRISRDRRPKIENAGITQCDIVATNGIVHEINDVIAVRKRSTSNFNGGHHHHIHSFDDILF